MRLFWAALAGACGWACHGADAVAASGFLDALNFPPIRREVSGLQLFSRNSTRGGGESGPRRPALAVAPSEAWAASPQLFKQLSALASSSYRGPVQLFSVPHLAGGGFMIRCTELYHRVLQDPRIVGVVAHVNGTTLSQKTTAEDVARADLRRTNLTASAREFLTPEAFHEYNGKQAYLVCYEVPAMKLAADLAAEDWEGAPVQPSNSTILRRPPGAIWFFAVGRTSAVS